MKTLQSIAGKTYVVTSPNGCTVTDETGLTLGTVDAGQQKVFVATGAKLQADDDSARITATFNSAPAKLRLLGLLGGGESAFKELTLEEALALANLPAGGGKMRVSLPWEAQLIVSGVPDALQTAKSNGWTITVQYREPEADSAVYNKYVACVTLEDVSAVNADYKNDLTAAGEWIYPLPLLKAIAPGFMASADKLRKFKLEMPALVTTYAYLQTYAFENSSLEYLELYAPKMTDGKAIACSAKNLKEAKITAPIATGLSECFSKCSSLIKAEMIAPKSAAGWYVFSNASSLEVVIIDYNDQITNGTGMYENCKKLKVFPTSYASLIKAPYMFIKCEITAQQAIEICQSIPQWSDGAAHAITLGIHIDYQNDEEVIAAIAEAEAKGWTLTVQWNGTPTAQSARTFGLRKPSIYAKVGTLERPDGTTEQFLDWGHYVTDWGANGYQEFASVEEAKEHFNIGD